MKNKIQKAFGFIKRYYKHPLFMIVYLFAISSKTFAFKIRFYTDAELIDLLKKGKSIIRLGDGDIVCIPLDLENAYHRLDNRLKEMYREIIQEYTVESSYVLSVPIFVNKTNKEIAALGPGKLNWGISMKSMFFLQFHKNVPYMDAHNFYYDNYFESTIAPLFLGRRAIFVTNKRVIDKQKANTQLPWKDMVCIEAPELHAMDAYERIKRELDEAVKGYEKDKIVIFFAMGPVGKYITYEYANRGYQGIDLGKGAEVMFTGESIQYLI